MRLLKIAALVVALALPAGGCAIGGVPFSDLMKLATAQVKNPVSLANVYELRNGYAAALEVSETWRAYCFSMKYAAIIKDPIARPICSQRRAAVRAIKTYGPAAGQATEDAEAFVRDHPTLDASAVISVAMRAVAKFRSIIPAQQ